jgi:hypothetical protein
MVMEGPYIEAGPELFLGVGPQLADLQLANLVDPSTARPGDVAVDLGLDDVVGPGGVGFSIVDRLLASPAEGVQAGVDHQADGPPDFVGKLAEMGVGVPVEAEAAGRALR